MIEAQIRDIAKISEKQFSSSNENSAIAQIN
jgi:hypothetical protein